MKQLFIGLFLILCLSATNAQAQSEHSTILTASGGLTSQPSQMSDANLILRNASQIGGTGYFSIEQNLNKRLFLETGFSFLEYYAGQSGEGMCEGCYTHKFYAYAFSASHFSLGLGKRFIGKDNHNALNLHAGVVLGIADGKIGFTGESGTLAHDYVNMDTSYHDFHKNYLQTKFYPLLYLGASKEFRIAGGLYFNLLYRYHQGLVNVSENHVQYTSQWTSGVQHAHIAITGSYHTLQAGLKYDFGNVFKAKARKDDGV